MTDAMSSGKKTLMLRHGWLLLLLLFAAALTASTAVHAREALGNAAISCGGDAHVAGDRDEVPADADQGVPHHHGTCHGHAVALKSDALHPAAHLRPAGNAFARRTASLTSLLVDPALRPPRA